MVSFSSLSVQLERHLQTLAVILWILSFLVLSQVCTVIFVSLFFTRFWLLSVLYSAWWYLDRDTPRKGGRQSKTTKQWRIWKYMADYFPISLIKTAELDPTRNYIAGFHPHGVLAIGAFTNFCTEGTNFSSVFPGIRSHLMMLTFWLQLPFFRDYIMKGGLVSSDKECVSHLMSKEEGGNLLVITVGGAKETLDAHPGDYTLLLKNRKGFVKLALIHGASLLPIFSFGENEIFDQLNNSQGSWLRSIQDRLQKIMGFPLPIFHGQGIFQDRFGLLPYRHPITTVVGKPIEVEQNTNPTQEEVDRLHQRYMTELCSLFEAHKTKYNVPPEQHLKFR
ncbi:2-acylglycerol O-acyltransferase 2-like [Dromiciops gliroides]|uniref:2-acylglycerol O-acyltransferase 2-like n=1 Tax=Dromiciops gliroides TaxID=33562 RepID=UPI001CC3A599|nr:2-acylglycerol O-acyltransferase 2-like [Dromiciops gliroides]